MHNQGENGCLIAPEVFEPVRRQLGVPDHVLDVLVAEPCLQRSRVVPGIGQGVPAGVAQHVREDGEGHTGAPAEALEQRAEALGRHWAAALTVEHVSRCLLLTLQAPQSANFVALHWMHRGGALFAPTDVQTPGVLALATFCRVPTLARDTHHVAAGRASDRGQPAPARGVIPRERRTFREVKKAPASLYRGFK